MDQSWVLVAHISALMLRRLRSATVFKANLGYKTRLTVKTKNGLKFAHEKSSSLMLSLIDSRFLWLPGVHHPMTLGLVLRGTGLKSLGARLPNQPPVSKDRSHSPKQYCDNTHLLFTLQGLLPTLDQDRSSSSNS